MTSPRTILMSTNGNDTILVKPKTNYRLIGKSCEQDVPADEIWTLDGVSYQFYLSTPAGAEYDPNDAMFHLSVAIDNFESNIFTRFAGCDKDPGTDWYKYKNEPQTRRIVGPAHIRLWTFNTSPEYPAWLYVNACWFAEPKR